MDAVGTFKTVTLPGPKTTNLSADICHFQSFSWKNTLNEAINIPLSRGNTAFIKGWEDVQQSPGNQYRLSRLTDLMVLFLRICPYPAWQQVAHQKSKQMALGCTLVSWSVSWEQEVATGEWAQSEGLWGPQGWAVSTEQKKKKKNWLNYNKCGSTVVQFHPLPRLTV